jgi:hypothetical protein
MDDFSFLEKEREKEKEISGTSLKTLTSLCDKMELLEHDIEMRKQALAKVEEAYNKIRLGLIPEMFAQLGITNITLENGKKVTVDTKISVSLPKKDPMRRRQALEWLTNNGGESIIKENVTVDEKGYVEAAKKLFDSQQVPYTSDKDVHPQTLKAFFNEALGNKKNSMQTILPSEVPEVFSLYQYSETKLK